MSRLSQLMAILGSTMAAAASAESYDPLPLNMPVGVTAVSRDVYELHMIIFWVCVVIAVVVFGVMAYSIMAHRKSKGVEAATFHESHTVEMIWTAVPFVILVILAIPAAKTLVKMEDSSGAELSVKITGYQWMWHYDYVDLGVSFYSRLDPVHNAARQKGAPAEDVAKLEHYLKEVDNQLVLPVGKKIRFFQTANDVIHSWWVPDLALKKDAIPGFINTNWAVIDEPGIYRGKCAELCGRDHGFMPIVIKAVPAEEFEAWVAEQAEKQSAALERVIDGEPAAPAAIDVNAPAAKLAAAL